MINVDRITSANSRFAKAGVSCFYDSEVAKPKEPLLPLTSADLIINRIIVNKIFRQNEI
jgi:hypothetical protein